MSNQSPAEALLRKQLNTALMANYPGTSASPQFLDDCMMFVTAYAATVEREAVYKMHEDIMELDKLVLSNEPDVAYNYARIHRWIDSYIERKIDRLAALQGPHHA